MLICRHVINIFQFYSRFMAINQALHFVNNDDVLPTNTDRFIKLGNFMHAVTTNFESAIFPGEFLTIDETLLSFKGRLSFKQFNRTKRARFGIKQFVLCDAAKKFILKILPYQGKTTQIPTPSWITSLGFGGAAVLTLLEGYVFKFHRLTLDNWFMSPALGLKLKSLDTYLLGTVQKRRKLMPKMNTKLNKGQIETYASPDILVERYGWSFFNIRITNLIKLELFCVVGVTEEKL